MSHSGPEDLTVTIDVEEYGGRPSDRFRDALAPLLQLLEQRQTRATFFVVGTLAPQWSSEIRELAARGHEFGLHGHTHQHLRALGPSRFREELAAGRDVLGDLVGRAPVGFRAPYFSLTSDTPWAPQLIAEAGFTYSSSVLPAWNPQAGLPSAPRRPFRWKDGPVEFPVPVFGIGWLRIPVLGGAYLRLVPGSIVRAAARSSKGSKGTWTYSHPYDFDTKEPFQRLPEQSLVFARLLFARRSLMLSRLSSLVGPRSGTLEALSQDSDFIDSLPEFSTEKFHTN